MENRNAYGLGMLSFSNENKHEQKRYDGIK